MAHEHILFNRHKFVHLLEFMQRLLTLSLSLLHVLLFLPFFVVVIKKCFFHDCFKSIRVRESLLCLLEFYLSFRCSPFVQTRSTFEFIWLLEFLVGTNLLVLSFVVIINLVRFDHVWRAWYELFFFKAQFCIIFFFNYSTKWRKQ